MASVIPSGPWMTRWKRKQGTENTGTHFQTLFLKRHCNLLQRTEGYKEEYNALLSHCFLSSAQLANHKVATNVRSLVAVGPWQQTPTMQHRKGVGVCVRVCEWVFQMLNWHSHPLHTSSVEVRKELLSSYGCCVATSAREALSMSWRRPFQKMCP